MENVITASEGISGWPKENTVRGRYYLSQVLLQQAEVSSLEMEAACRGALDELLKLDDSDITTQHRDNLPMLFDYLVHWENRLVTPRRAIVPVLSAAACTIRTNDAGVVKITAATLVEQNQAAFSINILQPLKLPMEEMEKSVQLPRISTVTLEVTKDGVPVRRAVTEAL